MLCDECWSVLTYIKNIEQTVQHILKVFVITMRDVLDRDAVMARWCHTVSVVYGDGNDGDDGDDEVVMVC